MFDKVLLGTQHRADPVAGVVDSVLHGYGHSSTARRRWRTRRALGAFVCQMGERISSTSALVTSETGILPMRGKANRLRLDIHSRGDAAPAIRPASVPAHAPRLRQRRDAFGAALLGKRVPTLAGERAVGERLLPGFGQGNEGNAAESELTAAASDEEALNPAAGSAGLDEEVQSVAIGVSARRSGADEGR